MDTGSAEKRARLRAIKLAALVRDHLGGAPSGDPLAGDALAGDAPSGDTLAGDTTSAAAAGSAPEVAPAPFPGGAALLVGRQAWVLLEERPASGLGGALAWAVRQDAEELNLIAESATGLLARRAAEFRLPTSVWHAEGRILLPAVPEPLPEPAEVPAEHEALRDLIVAGGADPVVEHGVLVGEVDGLEVCRIVTDPTTGAARLEVGVGAHDRESFAILHGDKPTVEALQGVVEAVRPHRRPDASPHALNRLAGERALRARALEAPGGIGASELRTASPPVPRANVKDPVPCVATGRSLDGRTLLAVFSSGVDLDLVPFAADARLALEAATDGANDGAGGVAGGDIDLVLVLPERDRLPVTEVLAGLLRRPARIVGWAA